MQEKDFTSIEYFEDNERFADLVNGAVFEGRNVVCASDIRKRDRVSFQLHKKNGKPASRAIVRDISRDMRVGMKVVLVAVENQSDIHYAMPLRVMKGDCADYDAQWRSMRREHEQRKDLKGAQYLSGIAKDDRLIPVFTLVLYFGKEKWDGPRCLKDMLDLTEYPEEIKALVGDYPMNLIEVREYAAPERFRTDLQYVFGFLANAENGKKLQTYVKKHEQAFSNMREDAYDLISVMSHSREMKKVKEMYRRKGGGYNMCEGIRQLIEEAQENGICAYVKLCREMKLDREKILSRLIDEFGLSMEKAQTFLSSCQEN